MAKIHFPFQKKEAEIDKKKTIIDYARKLNIAIDAPCGGRGLCGKCKVKVDGIVSKKNKIEQSYALGENYRLACQTIPLGETYVTLLEVEAGSKNIGIIRDIEIDRREGYGIALDIGTTTLAAYLVDTHNGEIIKEKSALNPQRVYGDDVITRIRNKSSELYQTLKDGINNLLNDLLTDARLGNSGIKPEDIHSACVVGNPTMHHFFLGYDVTPLGRAPYQPISKKGEYRKAKELGLNINPEAVIYTPPIIAGFIGSDILADILASQIYKDDGVSMLIDFGTNGEIVLYDGERILTASCAIGPAFEGGRIEYGSIAKPGAIDRVKIVNGRILCYTIGNKPPISICGTGIIDTVAELYRTGKIDRRGIFTDNKKAIQLAENISFSEKDIVEVRLAKSAMQTAQEILLKEGSNLSPSDLTGVYIAGSFGNYINPGSAKIINLIPNIPLERVKSIGNAAGEGAREMLLSEALREEAEGIAQKIEYLELMDKKYGFNDKYIDNMFFS